MFRIGRYYCDPEKKVMKKNDLVVIKNGLFYPKTCLNCLKATIIMSYFSDVPEEYSGWDIKCPIKCTDCLCDDSSPCDRFVFEPRFVITEIPEKGERRARMMLKAVKTGRQYDLLIYYECEDSDEISEVL